MIVLPLIRFHIGSHQFTTANFLLLWRRSDLNRHENLAKVTNHAQKSEIANIIIGLVIGRYYQIDIIVLP